MILIILNILKTLLLFYGEFMFVGGVYYSLASDKKREGLIGSRIENFFVGVLGFLIVLSVFIYD